MSGLINVSVEKGWTPSSNFVKVPIELLSCPEIGAAAKVLWIVLLNQANFRPISKTQIDIAACIHRASRPRLLAELKALGLIKGSESHLILVNPVPILRNLRKQNEEAHRTLIETIYRDPEAPTVEIEPKKETIRRDYFQEATEAWNLYRPNDYAKIRNLSAKLLQAVDAHIKALNIDPHNYKYFFSVLKAGVQRSNFWSNENSYKTLQSIVGIGDPQTKKYANVFNLFSDGLEAPESQPTEEGDRKDKLILPEHCRKIIDDYDEAQHLFYECYFKPDCNIESASRFLIEKEEMLKKAGLSPADFRFMHHSADVVDWPTDTPAPTKPRETFWVYKK